MAEIALNIDPTAGLRGGEKIEKLLERLDNKALNLQRKLKHMELRVPTQRDLRQKLAKLKGKVIVRAGWNKHSWLQDIAAIQTFLRGQHVVMRVKLQVDKSELAQLQAIAGNAQKTKRATQKAKAEASRKAAATVSSTQAQADPEGYRTQGMRSSTGVPERWMADDPERKKGIHEVSKEAHRRDWRNDDWRGFPVMRTAQERQDYMMRYRGLGGGLQANDPHAQKFLKANQELADKRVAASRKLHEDDNRRKSVFERYSQQLEMVKLGEMRGSTPWEDPTIREQRAAASNAARAEGNRRAAVFKEYDKQLAAVKAGETRAYSDWAPKDRTTAERKMKEGYGSKDYGKVIEMIGADELEDVATNVRSSELEQLEKIESAQDKAHRRRMEFFEKEERKQARADVKPISKDTDSLRHRMGYGAMAMKNEAELKAYDKMLKEKGEKPLSKDDKRAVRKGWREMGTGGRGGDNLARELEQVSELADKKGKILDIDAKSKDTPGMTKRLETEAKYNKLLGERLTRMTDLENKARQAGRFVDADKLAARREEMADDTRRYGQTTQRGNVIGRSGAVYTVASKLEDGSGRGTGTYRKDPEGLKKYTRFVTDLDNEVAQLERREKKMNKRRSGAMSGWFSKFSIYMSGIAATLFVWQELSQAIGSAISTGKSFSDTLTQVTNLAGYTSEQTRAFDDSMKDLTATIGGMPKESAEAQKALLDIGASPAEQIGLLERTMVIARSGIVDMSEAARQAKFDSYGMADALYAMGKAAEDGLNGPMKRAKGEVALVMDLFFKRAEPTLMVFLKDFADWSRKEGPAIAESLMAITTATLGLLDALRAIVTPAIKAVGELSNLSKIEGMKSGGAVTAGVLKAMEGRHAEVIRFFDDPEGNIPDMLKLKTETEKNIEKFKKEKEGLTESKAMWGEGLLAAVTGGGKAERGSISIFGKHAELYDKQIKNQEALARWIESTLTRGGYVDPNSRGYDPSAEHKAGRGEMPDPAKVDAAWQDVYMKVGIMTDSQYGRMKDKVTEHANVIENTLGGTWHKMIEYVDLYHVEMQRLKPGFDALKNQFKFQGFLEEGGIGNYMDISMQQVEFEAQALERQFKRLGLADEFDRADYEKERKRKIRAGLDKPTVDAHKAIFQDTGIQTKYLEGKLKTAAATTRDDAIDKAKGDKQAEAEAIKQYDLKIIHIDQQAYARRLANADAFFSQTGKATGQFIEDQTALYESQREANIRQGSTVEEADRIYRAQINAFNTRLIEPQIGLYNDLYSTTGDMTDAHYNLKQRRLDLWVEYMRDRMGMIPEIEEVAYKRSLEIQADKLRSSAETWEGIRAGQIEVFLEVQSHAAVTADAYKGMVRDMDSEAKRQFFDVMEGRFDTFKDHAIGIFEAIRDAANEILYDSIKKMFMGSGNEGEGMMGWLIKGIGGASGAASGDYSSIVNPPTSEWGIHPDRKYDDGGWITEPVIGIGQRSGDTYAIAENNPEMVFNPAKGGKGQGGGANNLSIHVPVSVANGDSALAGRLQTEIENTVKTVLREEMA